MFFSPRTINLCQHKSSLTFWKKSFNKVSDNLLGQLLVLPAAKLKTVCTKLVYVQRSLLSNLEQNQNICFEGDIIRHHLWGQREINIEFLNLWQPLGSRVRLRSWGGTLFPCLMYELYTIARKVVQKTLQRLSLKFRAMHFYFS